MLNAITIGDGPRPVFFLHGLFGQGKNFGTVAKMLGDVATCILLDLPNHGRSGWTDRLDYDQMAEVVADDLVERGAGEEPVTLVGHSMGGRTAMRLALHHPELVQRLVVEDTAPDDHDNADEFVFYIDQMLGLDLDDLRSRTDADTALAGQVPDRAIRAFLLQNLHRDPTHGWRWLANLEVLRRDIAAVGSWPELDAHWDGPVLWIAGERSDHAQPGYEPAMRRHFPGTERRVIADAGHWVHSEQPKAFAAALRRFLV